MIIPKFIPIQHGLEHLRIEFLDDKWHIWINANKDFTLGTFIELNKDGKAYRVTWLADGTDHRFEITE